MSLPEQLRLLCAARITRDADAPRLPEGLTRSLAICVSLPHKNTGMTGSSDPHKVSLICNIALGIALIFSLFVSIRQNDTIKDQRQNIFEMSQNPYCLGAPGFRGRHSASPIVPHRPLIQDN